MERTLVLDEANVSHHFTGVLLMIRRIDAAEREDLTRRAAEEHDLATFTAVLCDLAAAAQGEDDLRRLREMLSEVAAAAQQKEQEAVNMSTGLYGESGPNELLERLLLLDRGVMEASMRIYNTPERDRIVLEAESRRLHDTIRKQWLVAKQLHVTACEEDSFH